MGNQIESSSYAAGITVQPSLQTKTAQSEKDKKKLNKRSRHTRTTEQITSRGSNRVTPR